jgi:hypothetical protein
MLSCRKKVVLRNYILSIRNQKNQKGFLEKHIVKIKECTQKKIKNLCTW